MTTKEQIVNNIKEWIHYDNEIKRLQKEVKIRKEKQKGYRIFNQEDYNFKYKTIDIREVIINFFNIFNLSTRNNNLMMETFHRQRFIQKFMQWIQTNKTKFV